MIERLQFFFEANSKPDINSIFFLFDKDFY